MNQNKGLWWENPDQEASLAFRRKVYNSKRWRATRLAVLAEFPFCVICEDEGRLSVPATDVDHICSLGDIFKKGLNPELAFDVLNLRGLCKKCHGKITAKAGLNKFNIEINKLKPIKKRKL